MNPSSGSVTTTAPNGPIGYAWGHAICMSVAWLGCATWGIYNARFVDKTNVWWFPNHYGSLLIGLLLNIVGFILILKYLDWQLQIDAQDPHHVVGFFIIIGLVLQVLLGWAAHKMWNPARKYPPWFPDRLHWFIGRFLWLASVWNVWSGINMGTIPQLGPTASGECPQCGWGVWIYVFVTMAVLSILVFKKVHHKTAEFEGLINK